MKAKTFIQSDPTFAAAIARVQPILAEWRKQRKHREPIPQSLWRQMTTLARRYGLNPVCRTLRVNYTALKRHLVADAAAQGSGVDAASPGFVELPMPAWPPAPSAPWVIELEDRRGSKLTLRLAQVDSVAALALAQGLWRQRA